ncbi:MAG: methyltransferase [Chloroflexota bacterium]
MDLARERAQAMVNGFRVTQMAVTAIRLGLPDMLAAGPRSVEDLAATTGTLPGPLRRVMRALAAHGFVDEQADGAFAANAVSELFRDQPGSMRAHALAVTAEGYAAWAELEYSVRTGKPAYEKVHGQPRWEHLASMPEANAVFNRFMADQSSRVAGELAELPVWPSKGLVVDVGGGNGALVGGLLQRRPGLSGVVFDLPSGLLGALDAVDRDGVADRCQVVAGDFFEAVPTGGDIYLLKQILHDWDDERAAAIVAACARAMRPGAMLLVVEWLLPEQAVREGPGLRAIIADVHMLVLFGGRERTSAEYQEMLREAGLASGRTFALPSGGGVWEAVRR